ncbi:MAG: ABC transporter substrate-binding protein, partial [Alphaproteobacteria bacterium]|nr:ABC transporter substrate-binding protein [Alphaproteobacteria bacterium]
MRRRDFTVGLLLALAVPTARAEQSVAAIGYLSGGSRESDNIPARLVALRQGLRELGYVEGQNLEVEYRWAQDQYERLPALAADLVRRQVSVIVAPGAPAAIAAHTATSRIPIVFNLGIDPVRAGFVASFNQPGGNITGVELLTTELAGKRLDLLHELLPSAAVVALL